MTKNQLIAKLNKIDGNPIIILASDSEGNHYDELDLVYDDGLSFLEGQLGIPKLTKELRDEGYEEEDVIHGGKRAIVLYP